MKKLKRNSLMYNLNIYIIVQLSASWSTVLDKILETPKGKGIKTFVAIIRKHITVQ